VDVFEVSALAVESSVYVHYHYTKLLHSEDCGNAFTENSAFTQNHLFDFYHHLQSKSQRMERVPLDAKYFALREAHGLCKTYDGKLQSYLIQSIAVQHETAMKNCVCVHLYDRVVRYVYLRYEGRTPKWVWKCRVYEELFSREHRVARNSGITELLETFGLPPDYRGFVDPEKN
jgi:hypothetical protein